MVNFAELQDDSTLDLGKEVERLRVEVQMMEQGYITPADDNVPPPPALAGFKSKEDFTIREQSLSYTNGDSYEGETLGSLRHGKGVHTCSNGDKYEGQWRYDKRDGTGKMTFARGLKYEGQWKDDKAHGNGAAQYENGGVYVGEFQLDLRCGWGTHYFPNGDKYEGEWQGDKITGKGRMTYADGSHFDGEWLENGRLKGKLVAGDGSSEYSGGWRDDLKHGYGVLFQRGMGKYMGQWVDDWQHGEGKCVYVSGATYDGQWLAGQRHGKGRYALGDYKYEGEWREDKQHGQGACQTDTGERYIGSFAEGKRSGKGVCQYADGSKYEGEWQDDKRHGKGTCLFANGDKYQGEWKADKRHGHGVCKFADGRKFRGDWEDDGWVQSAADPQQCRVAGPGVTKAVAGRKAELAIEARDDNGCLRLSGGDEFSAVLLGPASVTADVTDNGDGTYSLTYLATVAGVYELHIMTGVDEHVAHSPYPLRVLPAAPCAKKCQVAGEGRSAAQAGVAAQFTVNVHDEYGNRWFGDVDKLQKLLPLEASLSSGGDEISLELVPTREGQYMCSYTAPYPGFWRLHVTCNNQPLPRTPFSVQVIDPSASAAPAAAEAATQGAKEASEGTDSAGTGADPRTEQGSSNGDAPAHPPATVLPLPPPVKDKMRVWEQIAAAAFAADGSMEGWDSDSERKAKKKETADQKYIRENPGVPVIENLEDLWLVSKLQNERKAKEERAKQKRLEGMRTKLEQTFGPAMLPSEQEVAVAVKEILAADIQQQAAAAVAAAAVVAPAKVAARGGAARGGQARLRAAAAALSQLD